MRRVTLLLLALGCSPQPMQAPREPLTLRLDDELTLLERTLVFSAADEWRIATGGALTAVIDDAGALAVIGDETIPGGVWGPGRIRLNTRLQAPQFRAMALHELGHAYGLPHLPTGLMAKPVGAACIDAVALAVACELHPCTNPRTTCR